MTIKIKLTQEQADFIEKSLANGIDKEEMLNRFAEVSCFKKQPNHSLHGLCVMDLARALLIGYEVEPEYKTAEWVRYWKNDSIAGIGKISVFKSDKTLVKFEGDSKWRRVIDITGYAIPDEIKAEKERQKWAEIEKGDVLRIKDEPHVLGILKAKDVEGTILVETIYGAVIWIKSEVELYAKKVGDAKCNNG